MTDDAVERLRVSLYMEAIAGLMPQIEEAIERGRAAERAARDSVNALSHIQSLLEAMERVTPDEAKSKSPARIILETTSISAFVSGYPGEQFVYFIEAGDYIKIGYSRDPISRLAQIRSGHGSAAPEGLDTRGARILAIEPGGMDVEKTLHRKFSEHRVAGEWFEKNERLTHYIKSIATPA